MPTQSLQHYVDRLAELKKSWTPEDAERITPLAREVRFEAMRDGHNLRVLEAEAQIQATGVPLTDAQWDEFQTHTLMPFHHIEDIVDVYQTSSGSTETDDRIIDILASAALEDRYFDANWLEEKSYLQATGQPMDPNYFNSNVKDRVAKASYVSDLARIQQQWNPNLSEDERGRLHSNAQSVRYKALADGIDLFDLEARSIKAGTGKEATQEQINIAANSYLNDLIQRYNQTQTPSQRPIRSGDLGDSGPIRSTRHSFPNGYGETFSGADMVVFMALPGVRPIYMGTMTTTTYTVYREKKQVRTTGRISAKGITKGPRTISGKMIFTVINEHLIENIKREIPYLQKNRHLLMDELPSFDLIVSFGNEYGGAAGLIIQGITTVDEQKTMSIEDLFIENIFTYIARRLEPMKDINANISVPYNPTDWLSSSFNALGEEMVGRFNIDELMLSEQAGGLPNFNPFTAGPESWQYTHLDALNRIESEVMAEKPKAPLFVQVYNKTAKNVMDFGHVWVLDTPYTIKEYSMDELPEYSISQLRDVRDGKVFGVRVDDVVDYFDQTITARFHAEAHEEVEASTTVGGTNYILIETTSDYDDVDERITAISVYTEGLKPTEKPFNYWWMANSHNSATQGSPLEALAPDELIILPSNDSIVAVVDIDHYRPIVKVWKGPDGDVAANHKVIWTWELIDDEVDKVNNWGIWDNRRFNQWNSLRKPDGLQSGSANKILGRPEPYVTYTDQNGLAEVNPDEVFLTVGNRDITIEADRTSKDEKKWSSMPDDIILVLTAQAYKEDGSTLFPGIAKFFFKKRYVR